MVLTGSSVARPCGWHALHRGEPWALDVYLRPQVLQILVEQAAAGADQAEEADATVVLQRTVEGDWPLPSHYQLAPQPLAALDLLDYPHPAACRLGREVLRSLAETVPTVVALIGRTARDVGDGPVIDPPPHRCSTARSEHWNERRLRLRQRRG